MRVLITGGAGFIGCNLAEACIRAGHQVTLFDNLSRKGSEANLAWLRGMLGERFTFVHGDIRDYPAILAAARGQQAIYHLAAQTAVTTSVIDPRSDFEINALGTFNVLEAARHAADDPVFIFSSTNKVYGGMEDVVIVEEPTRYAYRDLPHGVSETYPLDFHSPYGCCYSEDTDILTRNGWKKFFELTPDDEVLTYNIERKVAQYQKPTAYFAYPYKGKMYVQANRRLKTCVTPNHKMLVAWDCNHYELEHPRLLEAQSIAGKPMAYLLAADVEGGDNCEYFILPEKPPASKYEHVFSARKIPMDDWLRFLGWYIAEGHCYENERTGNCTVTLTTYSRTDEAVAVMRAIGLSPVVDKHHVTATSKQVYTYVKSLGKSHDKHIPQDIKNLSSKRLAVLLRSLLDGDGTQHSKNSWKYTTVSRRLADDVQEIALKCGMAASMVLDKEGFYRVYINTTRTVQCNLGGNRSTWVDYDGMVYCVEVPNSVVMVRQNGYAYFSGNSKGAADQYVRDYARIYGLRSVVFRQSCLEGDSLVQTVEADVPIRDLQNPGQVLSFDPAAGLQRRTCAGPFSPPLQGRKLYYLQTSRGYAIRATEDHRFYTPGGYLPLAQIQHGGLVAVCPQARYVRRPAPQQFSDEVILDEQMVRAALADSGRQPSYIDDIISNLKTQGLLPLRYSHPRIYIIAQLVGYLTGDAHLYLHANSRRRKVDLGIQVYGPADELDAIKEDFRLLGFRPGKTVVSTSRSELLSGHVIEGASHKFPVYSSAAFAFFRALETPVGRKADTAFQIPGWVLRAPAPVQDAYLRGLFGAEMTAPGFYKRGDGKREGEFLAPAFAQAKAQSLEANARVFRQQIMDLLAARGVETRPFETGFRYRKTAEKSRSYQFSVLAARDNLQRFACIGYAYNRKRNAQLYRIVEFMQTLLPYQAYERWLSEHTYGLDAPELVWDHVVEKREVPLQPVYDITVSETHNFIANGFLVHNCIYGQRQMGVEDQGWVAWFIIAAVTGKPITIYGNGKQVRDLLHVDDLVRAFQMATERIDVTKGQVYNLGGGPANTLAVWAEFGPLLAELLGREVRPAAFSDWRPGDQPVFVADVSKAGRDFGWAPRVGVREGITRLINWVQENRELFQ